MSVTSDSSCVIYNLGSRSPELEGFHTPSGTSKNGMVLTGKFDLEMDDDWGYLYFKKPLSIYLFIYIYTYVHIRYTYKIYIGLFPESILSTGFPRETGSTNSIHFIHFGRGAAKVLRPFCLPRFAMLVMCLKATRRGSTSRAALVFHMEFLGSP